MTAMVLNAVSPAGLRGLGLVFVAGVVVVGAIVVVAGWIVCMQVLSVDTGPALSLGRQLAVSTTTV